MYGLGQVSTNAAGVVDYPGGLPAYRGGVDINLDHLEGAIREIRDSSYSITPASGLVITGKYPANNEASPKTIDEVVDDGLFKGETL